MRIGLILFCLIFSPNIWASICVTSIANFELASEVSFNGQVMAFAAEQFSDVKYFPSSGEAGFVKQIQAMVSGQCSVILGIGTSRECLIAGPLLQNNKVIGISAACAHNDISKYYPYLYTTSPSVNKEAWYIANYINTMAHVSKVFVIEQPTNVYSQAIFVQLKKQLGEKFVDVPVDSEGNFDFSKLSHNPKEPTAIILLTYPLQSVKIIVRLSNRKIITNNVSIIGEAAWRDFLVFFQPLKSILEQAHAVVVMDIVDWQRVNNSAFMHDFVSRYKRKPLYLEILSYDAARFAIQCYKHALVDDKYDLAKFTECMVHTKYNGVAGEFSFASHSSFADRSVYVTNVLEQI